jgi:hypothetical protein
MSKQRIIDLSFVINLKSRDGFGAAGGGSVRASAFLSRSPDRDGGASPQPNGLEIGARS